MTVKATRSWLWIIVVVLSGVCSGITGLYTGASLATSKYDDQIRALRLIYEKRISDSQTEHKQEMERLDRNTGALLSAVQALSGKVGGVVEQVSQVTDKVDHVSDKVDQTASTTAKTHEVAKAAVQESKLLAAKTDILSAKVSNAASAPRTVIIQPEPKPPVPAPEGWQGRGKK
jgi:uncharacterized phage infection (PIP) family protein YhgE